MSTWMMRRCIGISFHAMKRVWVAVLGIVLIAACSGPAEPSAPASSPSTSPSPAASADMLLPQESAHLSNIRQLSFGGENAEAYFSFDGKRLSFQNTGDYPCDQIFSMNIDGTDRKLISTGYGRTTCAFYLPDGKSFVYASTHMAARECPPVPDKSEG